jgi:outer membrane biosynthesis protein TonB
VLPLALLVIAALGAGIAVAVIRLAGDGGVKAGPTPTKTTASPTKTTEPPTTKPPTTEPPTTEPPTDEPTTEPPTTEPPTDEPTTPEPTRTRTGGGPNGTPTDGATPPLASTGGETAPWLFVGAAMVGVAVLLGRWARVPS